MMLKDCYRTLEDGTEAVLTRPSYEDAQNIIAFQKQVASETIFTGRSPEDCTDDIDSVKGWIVSCVMNPHCAPVLCYCGGVLCGICTVDFFGWKGMRHRVSLSFAVIQACWGKGISDALMQYALEIIATRPQVEQIEVDVFEFNRRARAFYERYGFRTISVMPAAFKLDDGNYLSEYKMVLEV